MGKFEDANTEEERLKIPGIGKTIAKRLRQQGTGKPQYRPGAASRLGIKGVGEKLWRRIMEDDIQEINGIGPILSHRIAAAEHGLLEDIPCNFDKSRKRM